MEVSRGQLAIGRADRINATAVSCLLHANVWISASNEIKSMSSLQLLSVHASSCCVLYAVHSAASDYERFTDGQNHADNGNKRCAID